MNEPSCPLCRTADAAMWFSTDRGSIFRCVGESCGLGFLDPQPSDAELNQFYEEYYYPEHGGAGVFENSTRSKSNQHFDALEDRLSLGAGPVLDYGCGIGNFLDVAARRGIEVAGVEFDDTGRAHAVSRGFRVEKVIDEYEPSSFKLIYMNDVIEHVRDPVEELAAIRLRLQPNGALFLVTMNMAGLKPRVRGVKWDVVTNPTHLWFYDERSLRTTLTASGFGRIEVQRWPVHFDHHGSARRLVQRGLQGLGLDASLRVLAFPEAS